MIPAVRAPGQPAPEHRGPAHLAGPIERSTGEGGDARALLLVLDAAGYGDGLGGLHVAHAAPPRLQRAREARVNVARTAWYTDRLPAGWWRACAAFDEVWVPSRTARGAFAAGGVPADRLRIVPSAVDTDVFTPDGDPLALEARRGFTFLSVVDWTWRKGWDVLVEAYLAEFSPDDDVGLVLKVAPTAGVALETVAAQLQSRIEAAQRDGGETADISIVWEEMPERGLAALYRAADCFVLPSRGDGYARALLEAQACGVAAIATEAGSAGEAQPPQSPFRLAARDAEVAPAAAFELPALTGQRWAEPDPVALRRLMRSAVSDPAGVSQRGAEAAAWVQAHHGVPAVAEALRDVPASPRLPSRSAHPLVHVVMPLGELVGEAGLGDLRGAVESIARQTHRDLRLTIVGGEDLAPDVGALAQEYGAEFVAHPAGATARWRAVIERWQAVESGYVAYLCHGDRWAEDKLGEQVAFIVGHRLIGAYCRAVRIDAEGAESSEDLAPGMDCLPGATDPGPPLARGLLVRRDVILGSGLVQDRAGADAEFEALLVRRALESGTLAKCLSTTFFWRERAAGQL